MIALLSLALPLLLGPEAPPVDGLEASGLLGYQIRLVDCEAIGWRQDLQPRLRFGGHRAGNSAWVADEATMEELAGRFAESEHSKIVSAPIVTAFAGSSASIGTSTTRHFVVHAEPGESDEGDPDPSEPRPVVAGVDDGSQIRLIGRPVLEGIHLKVDVIDSRISAVHLVESEVAGEGKTVQFQVPEVSRREMGGEWLLPEGHGLILSMGVESSVDPQGKTLVRERLLLISIDLDSPSPTKPEVDPRITKAKQAGPIAPDIPEPVVAPPMPLASTLPVPPRVMRAGSVPTALASTPWGLLPIVPVEYEAPADPAAVAVPAMPLPALPSRNLPPAIDTEGRQVDPKTQKDRDAERTDYAPFVDGRPVASPQVTVPVPTPMPTGTEYEGVVEPSRPEPVDPADHASSEERPADARADRSLIKVRFSLGLARGFSVDVDLGNSNKTSTGPVAKEEATVEMKADATEEAPTRR